MVSDALLSVSTLHHVMMGYIYHQNQLKRLWKICSWFKSKNRVSFYMYVMIRSIYHVMLPVIKFVSPRYATLHWDFQKTKKKKKTKWNKNKQTNKKLLMPLCQAIVKHKQTVKVERTKIINIKIIKYVCLIIKNRYLFNLQIFPSEMYGE